MSRRGVLVLVALAVATVALGGVLSLSAAVRSALLDPVVRWAHLFRFYFTRLSQSLIWFLFIAAGSAIWIRELYRSLPPLDRRRRRREAIETDEDLALYVRAIRRAPYSPYARGRLSRGLAEIAARAVAAKSGNDLDAVRAEIARGRWSSDPDVAAFLALRHVPADSRRRFVERLERAVSYLEQYRQEV